MPTAEELVIKGDEYYEKKEYKTALSYYDQALEQNADYGLAWAGKGDALNKLNHHKEALEACEKGIAQSPEIAQLWKGKGNALDDLGRYEEALQAYEKAIALDPKYASPWNGKGNALYYSGRYEEALQAYEKAIALDPKYLGSWHNKGIALSDLGRNEEALQAYENAIALDPKHVGAWHGKGSALYSLGRYKEALQAYEKAIALDPKYAAPWNNKGNVFHHLQDSRRLGCYQRAIFLGDARLLSQVAPTLLPTLHESEKPLLVEHVFQLLPQVEAFVSFQGIWQRTREALSDWQQLQNYRKAIERLNSWEDQLFTAITRHYLGNSITAFQLFDEVLDDGEHESLRMQYYFGQAASAFFEQEERVWNQAWDQANYKAKPTSPVNMREGYYAALIFLRHEKFRKAKKILDKQKEHLPSLYLRALIAQYEDKPIKKYAEFILQEEASRPLEQRLLNGFEPRPWNVAERNFLEQLQQYCYTQELAEIITDIHDYAEESEQWQHLVTEYHRQPFHKSFYLDKAGEKHIWDTLRLQKAQALNKELLEIFSKNMEAYREEVDTEHLAATLENTSEMESFENLKERSKKFSQDKMEKHLGNFIHKYPELKPLVYSYLLEYFYYTEAISAEQALHLYFFLPVARRQKGWSNTAVATFFQDIAKDTLKTAMGGGLFAGGFAASLMVLFIRYIRENIKTDDFFCEPDLEEYTQEERDAFSPYVKFKECFLQYLSDLRIQMGEDKFNETYKLEGFKEQL